MIVLPNDCVVLEHGLLTVMRVWGEGLFVLRYSKTQLVLCAPVEELLNLGHKKEWKVEGVTTVEQEVAKFSKGKFRALKRMPSKKRVGWYSFYESVNEKVYMELLTLFSKILKNETML